MNRINILDCTLRDGGYVNDFCFGETIIKDIVEKLSKASIDIIECGFLKSGAFDKERSLFGSVEALRTVVGNKNPNLMYVAMIQYGAIDISEIAPYDGTSIDGIRLTFHEHEIEPAFELGKQLMDKGYKVFMQPVGTMTYTDASLLELISKINILKPFAFYMVDTLGTMYKNDLLRMFYLIDHNLDKKIAVGFHSHNNLQLSFANAQELMQLNTPRVLIVDASVFGMGRGAGNLNTELVTQYINSNFSLQYDNLEILKIIDEYIRPLSLRYRWGYDAAYYIASVTKCHPNYATFLMGLQTLRVQDIHAILNSMDMERRTLFDKDYIHELYVKYMSRYVDDTKVRDEIKELIGGKKIVLLAPGKSLRKAATDINDMLGKDDCFVISVNFVPTDIPVDMVFVSNMRRFRDVQELCLRTDHIEKVVVTSNIMTQSVADVEVVNYSDYINEEQIILDNAGLMCINFLNRLGVAEILLAGFDGFSTDIRDNYYEAAMYLDVEEERLLQLNTAVAKKIRQLSTQMKIGFFSASAYQHE